MGQENKRHEEIAHNIADGFAKRDFSIYTEASPQENEEAVGQRSYKYSIGTACKNFREDLDLINDSRKAISQDRNFITRFAGRLGFQIGENRLASEAIEDRINTLSQFANEYQKVASSQLINTLNSIKEDKGDKYSSSSVQFLHMSADEYTKAITQYLTQIKTLNCIDDKKTPSRTQRLFRKNNELNLIHSMLGAMERFTSPVNPFVPLEIQKECKEHFDKLTKNGKINEDLRGRIKKCSKKLEEGISLNKSMNLKRSESVLKWRGGKVSKVVSKAPFIGYYLNRGYSKFIDFVASSVCFFETRAANKQLGKIESEILHTEFQKLKKEEKELKKQKKALQALKTNASDRSAITILTKIDQLNQRLGEVRQELDLQRARNDALKNGSVEYDIQQHIKEKTALYAETVNQQSAADYVEHIVVDSSNNAAMPAANGNVSQEHSTVNSLESNNGPIHPSSSLAGNDTVESINPQASLIREATADTARSLSSRHSVDNSSLVATTIKDEGPSKDNILDSINDSINRSLDSGNLAPVLEPLDRRSYRGRLSVRSGDQGPSVH